MLKRWGLVLPMMGVLFLTAMPAQAGVTGTGGGEKVIINTESETHTKRYTQYSTEYVNPVIRDRGTRYSYSSSNVTSRVQWHGRSSRWSWYTHDGSNTNVSFVRNTYEEVGDRKIGSRDDFLGYTHYNTRSTRTVTKSPDLIIVGDPDYLETAFVAQGKITQHTHVTKDYYDNYRHVTIRQKDYDLWHDYNKHTTNYYTLHRARSVTPIVLNLDGSGKLGASKGQWLAHKDFDTDNVMLFDFFGNGQEVLMEWVGPADGLLCVPKADGSVDGTCLFGSSTGYDDGFQQLSMRDADLNGVLTGKELEGLHVWLDRNQNGIAGPTELITVQGLEITEISVKHDNFKSSYKAAGKTYTMWDWQPNLFMLKRENPGA